MIYTFIPFALDKNYGRACNMHMAMIPNESDWGCIVDHDALLGLTTRWYYLMDRAIRRNPGTGLFVATTNRIKRKEQCYHGKMGEDHNIKNHKKIAEKLADEKGGVYTDMTRGNPIGGVVMLTSKEAWRRCRGFKDGLLGVDNDYHQRVTDAGYQVTLLNGLYVYHWYRGNNEGRLHLK